MTYIYCSYIFIGIFDKQALDKFMNYHKNITILVFYKIFLRSVFLSSFLSNFFPILTNP